MEYITSNKGGRNLAFENNIHIKQKVLSKTGFNCEKCISIDIVREPNSENCLDFIFVARPCEKVIIVPDANYITSEIRKFMLDMPSPGSFQNIGLLI